MLKVVEYGYIEPRIAIYFTNLQRKSQEFFRLICRVMPGFFVQYFGVSHMDYRIAIILYFEALLGVYLLLKDEEHLSLRAMVSLSLLVVLAYVIRLGFFDYETTDYTWFLKVWADYFRNGGGFKALKASIGNYNIPYLYFLALFSYFNISDLYLIKALSTLFDGLLAWICMKLADKCGADQRERIICFLIVLFLPTSVINSALWSQCDSIYVFFALLGVLLALDDKPVGSMIAAAVSFGFKLQAVFILPVFLILWFWKKYKWYQFLVFPLAYLVLILPAVLLGRPLGDAITLYFDQMGTVGSAMNYNAPSLTAFFRHVEKPELLSGWLIGFAFAAMGGILAVSIAKRKRLDSITFLCLCALMTAVIPYLLPHMHDRYFYMAEMLMVIIACCAHETIPAVICMEFGSLICYLAYLKTVYLRLGYIYLTNDRGAVAVLIAIAVIAAKTIWNFSKNTIDK